MFLQPLDLHLRGLGALPEEPFRLPTAALLLDRRGGDHDMSLLVVESFFLFMAAVIVYFIAVGKARKRHLLYVGMIVAVVILANVRKNEGLFGLSGFPSLLMMLEGKISKKSQ